MANEDETTFWDERRRAQRAIQTVGSCASLITLSLSCKPRIPAGKCSTSTSSARTCKRACAPMGDQRICYAFDIRLSISWLTADSMNAVEIRRPLR